MKTFSLLGFIEHLAVMKLEVEHANHHALEKVGELIEKEAKDVIGTYRYGWPQLAASTLKRKVADTPLLETGAMRDSIEHQVEHDKVTIGSYSKIALYQEMGTSRIPPRPFLQGAMEQKIPEALHIIGREVQAKLSGEKV